MLLQKWKYYAFDAPSLARCQPSITRHNVTSLRTISIIVACMLVLFSLGPLTYEGKPYKAIVYILCALMEGCVFFYANWLSKKSALSSGAVYGGFLLYYATLIAFGLYIGVVEARDGYAINLMIYMVCSQLMFVFTPLKNLLMNLITLGVFAMMAITFKDAAHWTIDLSNATIATLCSLGFNWYISHTLLKEKIASLSMEEERNRFREESETDSLTGLHNRRFFFETGRIYLDAWQKAHKSTCMLMIDIDYFKRYNDHFGHPKGDEVLAAIGGVLKEFDVQQGVLAARVGGEEFAVLFAENRIGEAESIARTIHQSINALAIPHPSSAAASTITTSIGLYFHRDDANPLEALYNNADKALYQAKEGGRNRIVRLDSASGEFHALDG